MRIHEEVRKMPVSPIRTWTRRLHDLSPRAELTLGEPPQSTDPRIGEAAAAALRQGLTHYPPGCRSEITARAAGRTGKSAAGLAVSPGTDPDHRRGAGSAGGLLPGVVESGRRGAGDGSRLSRYAQRPCVSVGNAGLFSA